jgi:hypothetical protein
MRRPSQFSATLPPATPLNRIEQRAATIGSDELIALAEWKFRDRPRKLKNMRRRHINYCAFVLREIERPR